MLRGKYQKMYYFLDKIYYFALLITYVKFTKKNAKHAWKKNQIRLHFYWA